jgi:hypothetical protein
MFDRLSSPCNVGRLLAFSFFAESCCCRGRRFRFLMRQAVRLQELPTMVLDKPVVWVFPELVVCLNCGAAEFSVPEAELCLLGKDEIAASE